MTEVRWIGPLGTPTLSLPAPSLLMVGGCPGAGKSELLHRTELPAGATILEADRFRGEEQLRRGGSYDAFDAAVVPVARAQFDVALRDALAGDGAVMVDAALLDAEDRAELIDVAAAAGRVAHLVVIDATLEQCRAAQLRRTRRVPDAVLRDYSARWDRLRAALARPGFAEAGLTSATVVHHDGARRIGRIGC